MMVYNQKKCSENKKYDKYFLDFLNSGITPCISICVVKHGEVIYGINEGFHDFRKSAKITGDTMFNVGSVTKTVTGAMIVKLLELGKITLHDNVKQYIEEFPFNNVEIHHLLTHTAGYDAADKSIWFEWPSHGHKAEYLQRIYTVDRLKYAPGEANEYYSFVYSILMDILERVTGVTLEAFTRKYLFDPIGMEKTTYDTALLKEGCYTLPVNSETKLPEKKFDRLDVSGDSGLYSNAADMVKFGLLLLNHGKWNNETIFGEPAVDLMLRDITGGKFGHTPNFWIKMDTDMHGTTNIDIHRCFGDTSSPCAAGHNGFSGCMFLIDPVYDMTACIVTNSQKMNSDGRHYKKLINVLMTM